MNTLHHLLFASALANEVSRSRRERRWLMLCAIAPDLDGITFWNRELWETVHHTFAHNVFFAGAMTLASLAIARPGRRLRLVIASAFSVVVVHYVIDLLISGTWPMRPLWPLSQYDVNLGNFVSDSERLDWWLRVPIQWTLVALAIGLAIRGWRRHRRTALELVSAKLDALVMGYFARAISGVRCAECGNRAGFKCLSCARPICGRHAKIEKLEAACPQCISEITVSPS